MTSFNVVDIKFALFDVIWWCLIYFWCFINAELWDLAIKIKTLKDDNVDDVNDLELTILFWPFVDYFWPLTLSWGGGGYFMYVGWGWCKITLNRKIKGTNQFLTKLPTIHHHYKKFKTKWKFFPKFDNYALMTS